MSTDNQTISSYNQGAETYNEVQPTSFYHKYVEKPAMFSLLPDLKNKKVLCIGVGTGQEAYDLKTKGAEVIGVDISEGMITQARKNFPDIDFQIQDMSSLEFEDNTFDFIYSSLAFHYAEDLLDLFKGIAKVLKHDGKLLFSTTHPVFDSSVEFYEDKKRYHIIGHVKDTETKEVKTFGDYFKEEKRTQDWGNNFIVNFNHRTISTWINSLVGSGFEIKKVVEPRPLDEAKELFSERYKIYIKRPGYIIFLSENIKS